MASSVAVAVPGTARPAPRKGLVRGGPGRTVGLLIAVGALLVMLCVSIAVGSKFIQLDVVLDGLFHFDPNNVDQDVVRTWRVPRTVVGLMAGVALGLAGAVMQGVSRNPLADPGILGINASAALAVLIAIQFFGMRLPAQYVWFAFAGAGIAVVMVYGIASFGRDGATPIKLALAGTAITAMLTSLATLIQLMDTTTMDAYRRWIVGSLFGRTADVAAQLWPFIVVGGLMALGSGRSLNALALGDDVARGLGANVNRSRLISGIAVMLLAGAATAAAGPIVFLGLTVPHIARAIVGPDYRWILPYSAVLAPLLLLVADVVGRIVLEQAELQVGIVTALLGAPVFVAIVRKKNLASL